MRSDGVSWETKMVCLFSGSAQDDQEEDLFTSATKLKF